jgi:hypothetical protein
MTHLFLKDSVYNRTKFKTWYYLLQVEQHYGKPIPWTVARLSKDTGVPRRSLQVLVIRWASPSWRRLLRRTIPDEVRGERFAYILGSRGRQWLTSCDSWIPESVREKWLNEIRTHQKKMAELEARKVFDAKMEEQSKQMAEEYFKAHGIYPEGT